MLKNVSLDLLVNALRNEHPFWTREAIQREAEQCLELWDESLSDVLSEYLRQGYEADLHYGEFSLNLIKALRNNCSYLCALGLMDSYIKDPLQGKALILRRQ